MLWRHVRFHETDKETCLENTWLRSMEICADQNPWNAYSRITHSLETCQNMKRRGTFEKEKYI